MTSLSNLRARVEGAEGPNFSLEEDLARLLEPQKLAWQAPPPPYTSSLDAALALVERVLPDCSVENLGEMAPGCGPLSGHWLAQLRPRQERRRMSGPINAANLRATLDGFEPSSAATPALALLAALLRALESTEAGG
jgi:hypothetical protein